MPPADACAGAIVQAGNHADVLGRQDQTGLVLYARAVGLVVDALNVPVDALNVIAAIKKSCPDEDTSGIESAFA